MNKNRIKCWGLIMKKLILGTMGIVVLIVFSSGCITSKNPNDDFYTNNVFLMEQMIPNADGNHVGETGSQEWNVTFGVHSKSGAAYSNIIANVTSYDSNNKTIASKIYTIPYLPAKQGKNLYLISKKEVDHVTMNIINATPSS